MGSFQIFGLRERARRKRKRFSPDRVIVSPDAYSKTYGQYQEAIEFQDDTPPSSPDEDRPNMFARSQHHREQGRPTPPGPSYLNPQYFQPAPVPAPAAFPLAPDTPPRHSLDPRHGHPPSRVYGSRMANPSQPTLVIPPPARAPPAPPASFSAVSLIQSPPPEYSSRPPSMFGGLSPTSERPATSYIQPTRPTDRPRTSHGRPPPNYSRLNSNEGPAPSLERPVTSHGRPRPAPSSERLRTSQSRPALNPMYHHNNRSRLGSAMNLPSAIGGQVRQAAASVTDLAITGGPVQPSGSSSSANVLQAGSPGFCDAISARLYQVIDNIDDEIFGIGESSCKFSRKQSRGKLSF
jgi:hypothetical protein